MAHTFHDAHFFVEASWNVMAHAQKPDLVFRRNGLVHLNRWGCQFSRLLAAEVCAWAVVMLDTPCSEVVWRVLATHYIRQFPLHFTPVRLRVPSHFNWSLPTVGFSFVQPGNLFDASWVKSARFLSPILYQIKDTADQDAEKHTAIFFLPTCAPDGHLQVWWYHMLYNTILTSWWWTHSAPNM